MGGGVLRRRRKKQEKDGDMQMRGASAWWRVNDKGREHTAAVTVTHTATRPVTHSDPQTHAHTHTDTPANGGRGLTK